MTNQQILEKAIQKAVDGGWNAPFASIETFLNWGGKLEQFIFNHDFAKALWGKERTCLNCGSSQFFSRETTCMGCSEPHPASAWQYHLQQMVIADDPIKYLGEHLDD